MINLFWKFIGVYLLPLFFAAGVFAVSHLLEYAPTGRSSDNGFMMFFCLMVLWGWHAMMDISGSFGPTTNAGEVGAAFLSLVAALLFGGAVAMASQQYLITRKPFGRDTMIAAIFLSRFLLIIGYQFGHWVLDNFRDQRMYTPGNRGVIVVRDEDGRRR